MHATHRLLRVAVNLNLAGMEGTFGIEPRTCCFAGSRFIELCLHMHMHMYLGPVSRYTFEILHVRRGPTCRQVLDGMLS